MTEERRAELEEKLNNAEAKGDPKEIAAVKKTMNQEYRLCTSHTADRLKRVEQTVTEIKEGLISADLFSEMKDEIINLKSSVREMKEEASAMKYKAQGVTQGAKILAQIISISTAAGGGALVLKIINEMFPH